MTTIQSSFSLDQREIDHHSIVLFFQISVKMTTSMFMTHNPSRRPTSVIPTEIRSLFRVVSLVKPEKSLILKAKCAGFGFKAPAILALRLKLVAELTKDLL